MSKERLRLAENQCIIVGRIINGNKLIGFRYIDCTWQYKSAIGYNELYVLFTAYDVLNVEKKGSGYRSKIKGLDL